MELRILLLLFTLSIISDVGISQQTILEENFEDGDITDSPAWFGDRDHFSITSEQENNLLQLTAPDEGESRLYTASTTAYGRWSLFIRFNSFSLSGSNNLTVFLMSDTTDLGGPVTGYALQAGESGSDDRFKIIRYRNGEPAATVVTGTRNINEGGAYRVQVTRSAGGTWTLASSASFSTEPSEEAMGIDNRITNSNYFGIRPQYTSTRTDRFFFDEFLVTEFPPEVVSLESSGNRSLIVKITNRLDPATVDPSDFTVTGGIGSPNRVSVDGRRIILQFDTALPGGQYQLQIGEIRDHTGTLLSGPTSIPFSIFDIPGPGDVVINEFMYDPPESLVEYVEIYNPGEKRFELEGWKLGDEISLNHLGNTRHVLEPGQRLVISSDTAALYNEFGPKHFLRMPEFPSLNNSGDQIRLTVADGTLLDSLAYRAGWGGEGVALERRSPEAPAHFRENWGESPDPREGTPGAPNAIPADSTPPEVRSVEIAGDQQVQILFSERVDGKTAETLEHYSLLPEITVSNARLFPPDTLLLQLNDTLRNATTYALTVSGVEDIFGNSMTAKTLSFTYYDISRADSGDVVINEFLFEPPAGLTEYIELYNPTDRSFDLRNWTMNDNTGNRNLISRNPFVLPPDSFAVLAPDSTLWRAKPGIRLLTLGTRFPALNNGGDDIVIRNATGEQLDSLRYRPAWGGDQVALERRAAYSPGFYRENWGDAPAGFGSPGSPNNIEPDHDPPELAGLSFAGNAAVKLIFNERISIGTATDRQNFSIQPDQGIRQISAEGDTISLRLARKLNPGTVYEFGISGLEDIFGNTISPLVASKEYLIYRDPLPGDLVINEILFAPSDPEQAEFVELFNSSEKNFNLEGWMIGDASDTAGLSGNITMKPGDFLVFTSNNKITSEPGEKTWYRLDDFPSLNDSDDAVIIRDSRGHAIDSLYYTSRWASGEGISLERMDPAAASNDSANWSSSRAPSGSTPGAQNSVYRPDDTPPRVIFSTRRGERQAEVLFSEFIRITPELKFRTGSHQLQITSFDSTNGHRVLLGNLAPAPAEHTGQTITIHNLTDVKGNRTETAAIPLAEPVEPGAVVINEIMFDPISKPADNLPDQSEYIELRSNRDYAVSLEGFFLHNAPDEQGEIRKLFPVSSRARYLSPGGYLLIYPEEDSRPFSDSRVARYFGLDGVPPQHRAMVDRGTLGLSSGSDAIYLADSTGTVIDSVHYRESWHNPNLPDPAGIALERIHPGGESDDPANWSSSTNEKGGTPGRENSIQQQPENEPRQTGISFSPNPFSPDSDGHEDVLFINYKLDYPDYLLKVRIFDRFGRHIRTLADGKAAGFSGSLQWDGLTDDGRRNRIGIYIVLFEAYNSTTGGNRTFKETVVLARRL
ncbi:MAG: lamin tail domain-containing protein [Balneolaceae bacterium]|nr:lamin tail domain-containing protein [Balneolaceae bacterium]